MMEFGNSLRAAREAKGYTPVQLAEMTRLAPSVIYSLENEDFSRIAAPIYGRGFVKLYCEAVGLDSKIYIAEFMNRMNGESAKADGVPAPAPEPAPAPILEPEPTPARTFDPPLSPGDDAPALSRYAAPFRTIKSPISSSTWRLGILALGTLAVLVLIIFALRALHQATTNTAAEPPAPTIEVQQPSEKTSPTAATKSTAARTPQKIPDLYLN